jgi:UDP-glucose 4-epimerase
MARIVVTGGSGFLGSHIADALSDAGHSVVIIDIQPSKHLRADQVFLQGDIRDSEFIIKAFEGADYIYHLAALADLNDAKEKPLETIDINIRGTAVLMDAAVKVGVKRFIFGSSVYVYSKQGSFYRCSKQACECYLEEYYSKYNLNYTVLRYGSLYGPRTDESNGVYRLLKSFMANDTYEYQGSKTDKREYIHVYDAAKLSIQILGESYENKHYILTGNDRLEVDELFRMFQEILSKKVHIKYDEEASNGNGHYNVTPYTYQPSVGKKLVTNEFVDMGQGIIQLLEEMRIDVENNE